MNSWYRLNQYLLVVSRALRATLRPRTWWPFLFYFLLQSVMMLFLYLGVRPALNWFFDALPDSLVPPEFFYYPTHLLLIPPLLYNRAMLPLGLFLESLLQAAATWIFIRHATGDMLPGLRQAVGKVKNGYGQFVVFWAVNYLLLQGSSAAFNLAFGDLWLGFARRRALLEVASFAFSSIFNSLLAYATIVILVERTSLFNTFRRSLQVFKRFWIATLVTVFAGTLITVPFQKMLESSPDWIGRFNPETLLAVTALSLLAGAVTSYGVVAVLSFWYLANRSNT